ncbi:MAG: fumarylacetoacetate hydrolase family protein [Deltaproteobacteria bacterium]|nr:MAG: fumarylacetoacetate hydrolase family protein [Deltaproteobacteria bacterium]
MHCISMQDRHQNVAVGKIVCVARNYAEHARELGNPVPDSAVLFIKPAGTIVADGGTVLIPSYSSDCHHEIELAVLIGRTGKAIAEAEALDFVAGFGVALDLTLRDVQAGLKAKGLPWEIAKAFDTSCPLSAFVPAAAVADPQRLRLRLLVNGEVRQEGTTADMLRPVARLISEASTYFTLEAGDILLTGTPSGVGPIRNGDRLEATIEGVGTLRVDVRQC